MPRPNSQPPRKKDDFKNSSKDLTRLFKMVFQWYPVHLIVVLICIVTSVFANVQGTLFMQTLIDSYIIPLTKTVAAGGTADFGPLLSAMARVAVFYLTGIIAAAAQGLIMARVTQGMMDKVPQASV